MVTIRPVSQAFLRTIRGSHAAVVDARVCSTFQSGVDPEGVEIDVLDGSVTADATADNRSTLDLTTTGAWPRRASDTLAPVGNEVFVRRGLRLAGGGEEWVSLGYHRLDRIEDVDESLPGGPIRIDATDRMSGIIDGRLLRPRQFNSSTTYGSVVEQLVHEVYPLATIDWDDASSGDTLGRSVIAEDDRYGFLNDLVQSLGKIWYWDYRGRLQIKTPPDPSAPVFTVNTGRDGVLVSLSRKLTREGAYNIVVASGEGGDTSTPVRAARGDLNPQSPTYVHGRFGPVPRFFSSPAITTTAQAAAAATTLLRQQLGLLHSVDFSMVPNVALEPGDPVEVVTRDGAAVHVLEQLTIPLTPEGAMDATTREQTTVLIGDVT